MPYKTLSAIVLCMFCHSQVSAQHRVFELRDGSIIRGRIYRRTDTSILVQSTDGNIYSLDKNKLDKYPLSYKAPVKGWVHSIQAGMYLEKEKSYPLSLAGIEADYMLGYRFKTSNIISAGAGTSIAYDFLLRYGLAYQRILTPGRRRSLLLGAGFFGLKGIDYQSQGGRQLHTELGYISHKSRNTAYTLKASYDLNSIYYTGQYGERIKYPFKSLTLKLGVMF